MDDLFIDDATVIPARELNWSAVRSTGPGGQNVNKVASKIVLRYDLAQSQVLSERAKLRLASLAGRRLSQEGVLSITSEVTRNQARNLRDARHKLAELVRAALVEPKRRRPTKPSAGARRRRVADKKQRSATKEQRRKPKFEG